MNFYLLLPLLGFVLASILAALTLLRDRKSLVHRTFALFLIFGGLWDFAIFGMRASQDMQHALTWEKAVMVAVSLGVVFLYHFSVIYSNNRLNRAFIFSVYLFPALVAIFSQTGLVMPAMQRMSYGWAPLPGPLFLFVISGFYIFAVLTLVNLIQAYKKSVTHTERNRTGYIIAGLCFSTVGGFADVLPLVGLPLYPGAIIGSIIFAILATVAILRHHLLDIHIVIRRSVVYFTISAMIAIPYVGIILLLSQVLGKQTIALWVDLLVLFVLAFALQPLWSRVQLVVDKWFYRERWEYFKALERFSGEKKDITDLGYLANSLIKLVSQAMQAAASCLLLLESNGKCFTLASSYGLLNESRFSFSSESALMRWLSQQEGFLERRQLDILPQLQAVTSGERKIVDQMGADLLLPLKTARGLTGVLVIGRKLSGETYSEDDLRLLRVVSQQMAITLENARMYRELKQTYDELCEAQELLLVQSEKLRTLGEMTSGIAHNFNNTLTTILGRTQLSFALIKEGKAMQNLEIIEQAVLDAAIMVRKLQDFARVRVDDTLDITDLNELVRSSLEFIKPRLDEQCQTLDSSIEVVLNLSETPPVEGCEAELKEALVNILVNAIEAMPQGGKLTVKSAQDGNFAVISIVDTGAGMTDDVQRRIFDPFFTTKGLKGLGMGLKFVHGTIDRHKGQVSVSSEPGRGSTFTIKIPVTTKTKVKYVPVESYRNGTKDAIILVVDDDKGPRDILYEILAGAGYSVDIAASGKEGLSLARQKDYDLVFTDLGMPDMSGWDLASKIRTGNSKTMVILVTGWGVQIDRTKIRERGVDAVIPKPFRKQSILVLVGQLLGNGVNTKTI